MDLPPRAASYAPHIKCSSCESDVPLHLIGEHVCSQITSASLVEEPELIRTSNVTQLPPITSRPTRPFVPRIDPFAPTRPGVNGELTPSSSGRSSAAASPISPRARSGFLHPPRKASAPLRRPPSPELLSQDCAFPPFPSNKPKKKDTSRHARGRTRTPEASSSRSFENERMRSASVGAPRSRLRQGTGDSSRPSTASSSRQASLSSRAGSRQGSIDAVPPLPPLQLTVSQPALDPGSRSMGSANGGSQAFPHPAPLPEPVSEEASPLTTNAASEAHGRTASDMNNTVQPPISDVDTLANSLKASSLPQGPSYKTKRPPPISNMPPQGIQETSMQQEEKSPCLPPPPPTPSSTLARTLTSIFGRKRGQSISNKKNVAKPPAADSLRSIALSPDPDPREAPKMDYSPHSSINTEMVTSPPVHGLQDAPSLPVEIRTTSEDHPEPSQGHITSLEEAKHEAYDAEPQAALSPASETTQSDDGQHETSYSQGIYTSQIDDEQQGSIHSIQATSLQTEADKHEASHDPQRDTLQMEQDLEKRLAAMGGVPRLSIVDEQSEEVKRVSIDSASSYGSEGFSYGSTSLRSFRGREAHSYGSSISTARTMSSNEEAFLLNASKLRIPDATPDSPTDPYLQFGKLTPVPETPSLTELVIYESDSNLEAGRLSTVHEVFLSPEEENEMSAAMANRPVSAASKPEPLNFDFPQPPASSVPVPPTPSSELDSLDFPLYPRQRRPSTPGAVRGVCRGCSKNILSGQKSVSSKDGRLTGKYHKECFVCMTCKEVFATADFYVHKDHPYCAHHYHVLNETLCESCGDGIEGHYLETSNVSGNGSKKFHPDCLKCATCKIQLNEDYFELGGRVYCEKDAFRMAHGPKSPYGTAPSRPSPLNREYISSVEPGQGLASGRFPERRLTRLMMT